MSTSTGIQIMSTNLLLENETDPVIWRGPVFGVNVMARRSFMPIGC